MSFISNVIAAQEGLVRNHGTLLPRKLCGVSRSLAGDEPLVTEAYSADEKLGNIAMAGVMRTNEGLQALGNAAHQLLDQQAYESVRILGARAIAQDPEFTNGNWWRGQARLELGDVAGALVDFERVLEKTPDFIDAHYWRTGARDAG